MRLAAAVFKLRALGIAPSPVVAAADQSMPTPAASKRVTFLRGMKERIK
jgi:hypothetical protein